MQHGDKISQRQLLAMAFLSIFSPAIRLMPRGVSQYAMSASWLSPLAAALPVFLFVLLMSWLMKGRGENEGLTHMLMRSIGNVPGKIVAVIIAMWLVFYAGFTLRTAGERMLSAIYENGRLLMFTGATVLAAAIASVGKMKSLARTAEVFVPLISIVIVVVLALAADNVELDNLLPVTHHDIPGVFRGTLSVINVICIYVYFYFLSGYVVKKENEGRLTLKWIGYSLTAIFLIVTVTVGALSAYLSVEFENPFFMMIKNITVLGIVERFEALIVAIWVVTDFIFLSALLSIASDVFCFSFNIKYRKLTVWILAAAVLAISMFITKSAFSLQNLSGVIIPGVNLIVSVMVVPFLLIVGKIRRRI